MNLFHALKKIRDKAVLNQVGSKTFDLILKKEFYFLKKKFFIKPLKILGLIPQDVF